MFVSYDIIDETHTALQVAMARVDVYCCLGIYKRGD